MHNRPSGNIESSREDIELTKRLVDAGRIMGIYVLARISICDENHLSLKASDLL